MFQLLNEKDKQALVALLDKDRIHNLQFYEYLPYLSNEDKRFGYYGKYAEGELIGAIYFSPFNMGFTIENQLPVDEVHERLCTLPSKFLFGRKDVLEKLKPIPSRNVYPYNYGSIPINSCTYKELPTVQQATKDDIQSLCSFYEGKNIQIEIPELIESFIEKGDVFIVKENQAILSAALAHSISGSHAIIGGVYTEDGHQGKGYAHECVAALTQHLHSKQITPFLFYDAQLNHLKRFYDKLGFHFECEYLFIHE